jgi:hypothetical protein
MKVEPTREIVIEIERVRTIKKRCRTRMLFCSECAAETDFITLRETASLFEVDLPLVRRFVRHHIFQSNENEGDLLVCLTSFLEKMRSEKHILVGAAKRRMIAP